MLVHLYVATRSLRHISISFILYLYYYVFHDKIISTILDSRPLIHSSALVILLLIPPSVLFISCLIFSSLCVFIKHFLHILHSFSKILGNFHYHYSQFFFLKYLFPLHLVVFLGFILFSLSEIIFCFSLCSNFYDCGFHSKAAGLFFLLLLPVLWGMRLSKKLVQTSDGRDWPCGKNCLALPGKAMLKLLSPHVCC